MYLYIQEVSPYSIFFSFFDLYHWNSLEINLLTETVPKIPPTPFICIASIVKFHSGILSHMVVLNSKTVHKVLANLCWLKLDLKDDQSNEKCRLSKYSSKNPPKLLNVCWQPHLCFLNVHKSIQIECYELPNWRTEQDLKYFNEMHITSCDDNLEAYTYVNFAFMRSSRVE